MVDSIQSEHSAVCKQAIADCRFSGYGSIRVIMPGWHPTPSTIVCLRCRFTTSRNNKVLAHILRLCNRAKTCPSNCTCELRQPLIL
eukprot:scaffold67379_cov33-Tisochrysis_lutea.AAC.2